MCKYGSGHTNSISQNLQIVRLVVGKNNELWILKCMHIVWMKWAGVDGGTLIYVEICGCLYWRALIYVDNLVYLFSNDVQNEQMNIQLSGEWTQLNVMVVFLVFFIVIQFVSLQNCSNFSYVVHNVCASWNYLAGITDFFLFLFDHNWSCHRYGRWKRMWKNLKRRLIRRLETMKIVSSF